MRTKPWYKAVVRGEGGVVVGLPEKWLRAGSVGGHITRRLVQIAEADRVGSYAPIGCLNSNYC
ncbi:small, acid-soluble spore protein, alpha/beta type [Paenibacillus sp. LPE1-1-1.1]